MTRVERISRSLFWPSLESDKYIGKQYQALFFCGKDKALGDLELAISAD